MSQLTLGELAVVRPVGDPLDRCYTPDPLADACVGVVGDLAAQLGLELGRVIEPSCGGGAFLRAARKAWGPRPTIGVDIDANAEGLRLAAEAHVGSWPEVAGRLRCGLSDIILGNPPFSGDTAVPHVDAALALRPGIVALILPWEFAALDRWSHVMDYPIRPRLACPIRPRPWGDRVRGTAMFCWTPRFPPSRAEILPLVWR